MPNKAPDDGFYSADGIPHKVRKGDTVPEGATFYADAGSVPPHVTHRAEAIKEATGAAAKGGKRGPSENTKGKGPSETLSATTTAAPTPTTTTTPAPTP